MILGKSFTAGSSIEWHQRGVAFPEGPWQEHPELAATCVRSKSGSGGHGKRTGGKSRDQARRAKKQADSPVGNGYLWPLLLGLRPKGQAGKFCGGKGAGTRGSGGGGGRLSSPSP